MKTLDETPAAGAIAPAPVQTHEQNLEDAARRILVIDDTPAIHNDFRKIFQSNSSPAALDAAEAALFGEVLPVQAAAQFQIDSAYQGNEALIMARQARDNGRPYQMAFLDVRMPPGIDGIETAAELWKLDPDLQIVICTAYSDYSWHEMLEKSGQSDRMVILKKPFDTIEALQLAHALTEKWRLQQANRQKVEDLERKVKQRTAHLQREISRRVRREHCLTLQHDVTRLLADSTANADKIIVNILEIICGAMDWDIGELWIVDRTSHALRSTSVWHRPESVLAEFKALTQQVLFSRGHGVPGMVWETKEPAWIVDIGAERGFLRTSAAHKAGLRAAFAFPLRASGEFLGVIEFLSRKVREREDDVVEVFGTMSSLIGQSIVRRKLEEQLRHSQKMDAIGHLAGGVAHDFNNMLTVIQGFVEILEMNKNLDGETSAGLTQIANAARRASNLTRQLLTFSRKHLLQTKPLDLNQVIGNLSKMLRCVIGEDLAVQIDCCTAPAIIEADEDMISQVIMNLAVNARDAMPVGGTLSITTNHQTISETHLTTTGQSRAGEFICLSVKDSGCGISPEVLPHIFEPFFTTKGQGKGTGLGLSTVYGIVEQHRGWIEIETALNSGTTFNVFLPRRASLDPLPAKAGVSTLPRGTETILLVEDEVPVRLLSRKILERLGYRVIEAASGPEALSIWEKQSESIQLVLTDMVMPDGMSGRDLIDQLLEKRPNLKFIYCSGYSPDHAQDREDLREGVNFLQKPYQAQALARTLRTVLECVEA